MTYYVSSGTLNPTHSLTHSLVLAVQVQTFCKIVQRCVFHSLVCISYWDLAEHYMSVCQVMRNYWVYYCITLRLPVTVLQYFVPLYLLHDPETYAQMMWHSPWCAVLLSPYKFHKILRYRSRYLTKHEALYKQMLHQRFINKCNCIHSEQEH